jgi:hypothetical protein
MIMKMAVFWDVTPCSLVDTVRRFRQLTASIIREISTALTMEAVSISERQPISTRLHGTTSQKTAIAEFNFHSATLFYGVVLYGVVCSG